MFRLFRGLVAEGLGLGGLIWAMTLFSGADVKSIDAPRFGKVSFESQEVVTLRKPAIYASLEPPVESQQPTFFRGTDSLFDR